MQLNEIIDTLKKEYQNDVVAMAKMDCMEMRIHIARVELIEEIEKMAEGDLNGKPITK